MPELLMCVEDFAQEAMIKTLTLRIAKDEEVDLKVIVRSAFGGVAKAIGQLADAAKKAETEGLRPDGVLVARDANCLGYNKRRQEVEAHAGCLADRLITVVPDPHIERWFLLDSHAFKEVVGHGCKAPDEKCQKDRYKSLLRRAVREAGLEPEFGGVEHAEKIAANMDLVKVAMADQSFGHFRDDLRTWLKQQKQLMEKG
jgi:hypothetical protein